jgi:hypothetical protein
MKPFVFPILASVPLLMNYVMGVTEVDKISGCDVQNVATEDMEMMELLKTIKYVTTKKEFREILTRTNLLYGLDTPLYEDFVELENVTIIILFLREKSCHQEIRRNMKSISEKLRLLKMKFIKLSIK